MKHVQFSFSVMANIEYQNSKLTGHNCGDLDTTARGMDLRRPSELYFANGDKSGHWELLRSNIIEPTSAHQHFPVRECTPEATQKSSVCVLDQQADSDELDKVLMPEHRRSEREQRQ